MYRLSLLLLALTLFFLPSFPVVSNALNQEVLVVNFEGTISTMSVELLKEALAFAESNSQPIILTLNTPGGSLDATFEIWELIENSKVPVIGYVYPKGARAASAGTYILLSTHIAAMAPNTIIGSCQPISFSFEGSKPVDDPKTINHLVKLLRERAAMHNRNEEIAELFITENLNLNAEEAKEKGVIEFTANSLSELLEMVDGLTVFTTLGEFTFHTRNAKVTQWSPSVSIQILKTLSEPMIALLMLMIGVYALIFGLTSPGVGGEIIGGILLVLGLIGLGMIKGVFLGSLILIGLGAVLLLYELFTPGFGIMGSSGLVCIFIGSLLLFPREWAVSPEWLNTLFLTIIIIPLAMGGFFIFLAYKVIKVRRMPPFLGRIVGGEGEVIEEITPEKNGFIIYQGEYWKAKSSKPLKPKQKVFVTGKEGPVLIVKPKEAESEGLEKT